MNDEVLKKHMEEDAIFQKEMAVWKETVATKEDIQHIVETAITNFFKSEGKRAYAGLLVVAGVVGALVVIGGGLKSLLAWIGFQYLK